MYSCNSDQLDGADQSARAQKAAPKITVSYLSFNMPAAIVWIAKEERLFAKYGLNEELIFIPGGPTAMSALVSGNIDFAQLRSIDGKPGRLRARWQREVDLKARLNP